MGTIVIEFKAKVKEPGFFKFPMIKKNHVVSGLHNSGPLSRWSNSDMFESVLNRHLKRELMLPVGLTCIITDVGAIVDGTITVTPGFLHTFRFEVIDQ